MKSDFLLKLGLVALLGAGLFVAYLLVVRPTTGICRGAAKRIQLGMSMKQVMEIIDGPQEQLEPPFGSGGAFLGGVNEWSSDNGRIKVYFGADGNVMGKEVEFTTETIAETLRRWLHLD
jgi:hypothetical protein